MTDYDALVKTLKELTLIVTVCHGNTCDECDMLQRCDYYDDEKMLSVFKDSAYAIEELQRQIDAWVEPERKALIKSLPRWISVKERLPKTDGMYLVHGTWSASGRKVTDTCEFYVHDGYFRAVWNFDVTHWMPLPAPPKEETE